MKAFSVYGPFPVPLEPNKRSKLIAKDLKAFWASPLLSGLVSRQGVYIFGVRAGKGITPWYVGKAVSQGFAAEVFAPHKLNHYAHALAGYVKGSPVLFFIAHPLGKGKVNGAAIGEAESFLINLASQKNPELCNIKNKPTKDKWRICGVVRPKAGEGKAQAAAALSSTLGIAKSVKNSSPPAPRTAPSDKRAAKRLTRMPAPNRRA